MDHHQHIVCPNCGYHATENYCARCGQETHLHADTVRGLIVHFTHHYFHYESKFWKTLKALWTRPGALTVAYWKQQRMRYLPPISLYIFLSAVFFISGNLLGSDDDVPRVHLREESRHQPVAAHTGSGRLEGYIDAARQRLHEKRQHMDNDEHASEKFAEQVSHAAPKVFFFLIPLMAVILRVLFARSRQYKLVHHTIFSLHIHAFWFSALTLVNFYVFDEGSGIFLSLVFCGGLIYNIFAFRNAYQVGWGRSIAVSMVTNLVYGIFLLASMLGLFAYYLLA